MSTPARRSNRLAVAAPLLAVALGVAAWAGEAAARREGALPGPAPRARASGFDVARAQARCEGCHEQEAREWRGSMHRQAWTDPVFQKAYAIEPVAFCRGCHAPEADPRTAPSAEAAAVGVACTTCHVDGGHVVGARATEAGEAAHAMRAEPRLAGPEACAGCHQFDFPGTRGAPMQDTAREHARSSFASVPCQDCHMPSVQGADGRSRRSHRFAVIGDEAMIRSALHVDARLEGLRALELELEGARVGHAFPTGDMFRRLELRARVVGPGGVAKGTARPVHLGRSFGDVLRPGGDLAFDRVPTGDTRVPPPGAGKRRARLAFDVDLAPGDVVAWEVAYQRMDDAMAASFGVDAVHDEVRFASGRLVVPGGGTAPAAHRETDTTEGSR